jgi:aminopeptidase N
MTTSAELSVAGFVDLVVRRIGAGPPPPGLAELLARAVTAADYYAVPAERPGLRRRTAAAALNAARHAEPGGRAQRALATGFAASADGDSQLGLLRSWLNAASLPGGVRLDLALRAQILATLSAQGRATDADLDAFAADDPAGGEALRATCRARRPDPQAKDAAWTAALDRGQSPPMACAHASGIWVPGQEDILARYCDRYFTEALPALRGREPRAAQELAELLFPATLAGPATIDDASAALARADLDDALRTVLLEQRAILQQVLAARAGAAAG